MKLFTELIEENNFHNAWVKAINAVQKEGADLVIGGAEQRKPIKDSCMLISLSGNAIKQIEGREIHPQYPFKRVDEYCEEFTRVYLEHYRSKPLDEQFAYLYFDRLSDYVSLIEKGVIQRGFDQLKWMREMLAEQIKNNITSNRVQAITWYPTLDTQTVSPACFQRAQIRYIPENKVDVHLTWRSRDLYAAWQSNVICLIDMLNREVIKPNNCEIVRIIDFSDSLHIYKTDLDEAKKVKLIPVSPQEM